MGDGFGVILRPPLCRYATAAAPRLLPLRDCCRSAARRLLISGGELSTCPASTRTRSTRWSGHVGLLSPCSRFLP